MVWNSGGTAAAGPAVVRRPLLSPLIRYLGLRELARRPDDDRPTWDTVFGTLRETASADGDDRTDKLHHELALGNRDQVVAEFADLLPVMADRAWLALLDQVTATPDPRWRFALPDNEPAPRNKPSDVVARVVEGQHAAADPQLSDPETLHHLYSRLRNDFGHLAGNSRVFLQRAEYYAGLAQAFS